MQSIVCDKCGSTQLREENGYRICVFCGTRFLLDRSDIPSPISHIDLGGDVETLLRKCREEPHKARKYANLILDIDPTNTEALKYLR